MAMQAEANHVEEQQEDEHIGPQLINKLEVSFNVYVRTYTPYNLCHVHVFIGTRY